MIKLRIVWIFLLSTSTLFSQTEKQVPGTYILKEKLGLHVEPGMSFGDVHLTSYVGSVDTTITHTLILDSLYNATFIADTLFGPGTSPTFDPTIKLYGKWSLQADTLLIQYFSTNTVYNHFQFQDTLVGYIDGVEYKLVPDEEQEPIPLEKVLFERLKILTYEKNIDTLVYINETRARIRYIKQ